MKRQEGFTLVELMVVIAILGILMASAVPAYQTWKGRAYGSEAAIMVKQILNSEIIYYMEHDEFYPNKNTILNILHDYPSDHDNVKAVLDNLNLTIPTGHFLDYYLTSYDDDNSIYSFQLIISSLEQRFNIFKDVSYIAYKMDKDGNVDTTEFREPVSGWIW